jgi:flagellar hook-associated protein 2
MSTPITLSGFNDIDFASIVTAIMAQERRPSLLLQQRQLELKSQTANFSTLSSKLSALDSAATKLANPLSLSGRSSANTDPSAVSFTAGSDTPLGTYDIVVNELARAQVTASSTAPDTDTTIVATGGSLTIGGVVVTLGGDTTLQGLADAINGTEDIGVTASVVQSAAGAYSIVLTGKETGAASAFSVVDGLSDGTVTFGAPSQPASDASITVNNVTATSSTNTFTNVVNGATIAVQKKSPDTVTITVNQDASGAKALISEFVAAYNDLVAFTQEQQTASRNSDNGSIGRDSVLRSASSALRQALGEANAADSTFQYLATVGIGFTTTGQLTFDASDFDSAAATGGLDHLQTLFSGDGSTDGVFGVVHDTIAVYTASDGLVTTQQSALAAKTTDVGQQIADFEARLKVRQEALTREFIAADRAMSTLKAQQNSLSSLGGQFRLF